MIIVYSQQTWFCLRWEVCLLAPMESVPIYSCHMAGDTFKSSMLSFLINYVLHSNQLHTTFK